MAQRHPQPHHHRRLLQGRPRTHPPAQLRLRRRPPGRPGRHRPRPTPVEFVLHAPAAGPANIAAARNITRTEVRSTVTGDIDLNGILGPDPEVRHGDEQITVRLALNGDAPASKLRQLLEQSRARSAVYDIITNQMPITIQVDTP